MEISEKNNEHEAKETTKKSTSKTRFLPLAPTYVVGFAFQETYDDLVTAQKMICYKRSPQGSSNSITPKNSGRNLFIDENGEKSNAGDAPEDLNLSAENDKDEVNIITDYVVDNKIEDESTQPEVIYQTSKSCKKMRQKTTNKAKSYKHIIKVKNVHSKTKSKSLNKNLGRYFDGKAVNLNELSNKIKTESISKIISRSRMLKKVSAKESLIEDEYFKDQSDNKSNDDSFITANGSFYSYSSQDTLTCKDSRSQNSDSVESVIYISPDMPYRTSVINVSRAVVKNATFGVEHVKSGSITIDLQEGLTSTEAVVHNMALTSEPISETSSKVTNSSNLFSLNTTASETSIDTLTEGEKASTTEVSDEDDPFYNAKTSSCFNKSDYESNSEIDNVPLQRPDASFQATFAKTEVFTSKPTLMDTVLHLGMFPEIASHSSTDYPNDVIITQKFLQNYSVTKETQNIGDDPSNGNKTLSKNVTQKSFTPEPNTGFMNTKAAINLPYETDIKEFLKETRKNQNVPCSEELKGNPSNLSELWERLLVALDSTAKRIEESISEKILKEIKRSLIILEKNKPQEHKDVETGTTRKKEVVASSLDETDASSKGVNADNVSIGSNQGLQCSLVQNEMIDRLMHRFTPKDPQFCLPSVSHQKDPKFIRNYFETLKPPGVKEATEGGDTITLSAETVAPSTKRLQMLYPLMRSGAWCFLKENVFVLTSVPIFFAVLIVVYLIIIFIVKLL